MSFSFSFRLFQVESLLIHSFKKMHSLIQSFIHPFHSILSFIHSGEDAETGLFTHSSNHSLILFNLSIHPLRRRCRKWLIHSLIQSFIPFNSFIHPLRRRCRNWLFHSLIHSFNHSSIHSIQFIHSFYSIHPFIHSGEDAETGYLSRSMIDLPPSTIQCDGASVRLLQEDDDLEAREQARMAAEKKEMERIQQVCSYASLCVVCVCVCERERFLEGLLIQSKFCFCFLFHAGNVRCH